MNSSTTTSTLLTLVVALAVVLRFLMRELRARTVRLRTLWVRPAILILLTALLVAGAFAVPGVAIVPVVTSLVVGSLLGAITGALVVRSTTFAPATERGAMTARGSGVTVVIWVVALALRLVARYAFAGAGATQAAQFELNIGLVALVTAAFIVVAVAFRRAILRLAPAGGSTSSG